MNALRKLIIGDAQADRVVPPSGFTAQLTLFVSGAMAFLCVFVLRLFCRPAWLAAIITIDADIVVAEITGVEDAVFCHNHRFICAAESKEGAIKLAKLALSSTE